MQGYIFVADQNGQKLLCWAPGANCGDNLAQAVCVKLVSKTDSLEGYCPSPGTPIPKANYFTYNASTNILTLYQATAGSNCSVNYTSNAIDLNSLASSSSPYDIGLSNFGYVPANTSLRFVFVRNVSISASDPGRAISSVGPVNNWTATIRKNGTQIGTITFLANQTTGTVSLSGNQSFVPGDILEVLSPSSTDPNFSDFVVVFKGQAS